MNQEADKPDQNLAAANKFREARDPENAIIALRAAALANPLLRDVAGALVSELQKHQRD